MNTNQIQVRGTASTTSRLLCAVALWSAPIEAAADTRSAGVGRPVESRAAGAAAVASQLSRRGLIRGDSTEISALYQRCEAPRPGPSHTEAHLPAFRNDPLIWLVQAPFVGTATVERPHDYETITQARRTTDLERAVGELRSFALLPENWDGEGAAAPSRISLRLADDFVRLMTEDQPAPDPMMLSSGNAGLFWNDARIYADLEFLADRRIAYFIEWKGEGRHKGVVAFDSRSIPGALSALLFPHRSASSLEAGLPAA